VYLIYETFYGVDGIVTTIQNLATRVIITVVWIAVGIMYFILIGYLVYRPVRVREDPLQEKLLANEEEEDEEQVRNAVVN